MAFESFWSFLGIELEKAYICAFEYKFEILSDFEYDKLLQEATLAPIDILDWEELDPAERAAEMHVTLETVQGKLIACIKRRVNVCKLVGFSKAWSKLKSLTIKLFGLRISSLLGLLRFSRRFFVFTRVQLRYIVIKRLRRVTEYLKCMEPCASFITFAFDPNRFNSSLYKSLVWTIMKSKVLEFYFLFELSHFASES